MPADRDQESLLDIVEAAQQIQVALQSLTLEEFKSNREKQAAISYFCIIIGEATKRISQGLRTQNPDGAWREMAGLRDILAHQYERVDLDELWEIAQVDVPDLLKAIETLLTQ
jgi:uncharacterized protein with HEPN domain